MLADSAGSTPARDHRRVASSIERRDGSALQESLADDFIGPDGLDRDGARRTAQLMFLRYPMWA